MVTWDGTVKILSFGISSKGFMDAVAAGVPPSTLYYMSPEQVSGDALDGRSNLFTWGAMLYEMVTDHKPFEGEDADEVRRKILEEMPVPPVKVNPTISTMASDVIVKALAKDPAQRYQSGRDMANDLEKCRESTGKAATKPPKGTLVPIKRRQRPRRPSLLRLRRLPRRQLRRPLRSLNLGPPNQGSPGLLLLSRASWRPPGRLHPLLPQSRYRK